MHIPRLLLAAMFATSVSSYSAHGQVPLVTVSASTIAPRHFLTANALSGIGISTAFGKPTSTFTWRVALERFGGAASRFGLSCGGFILPGPCEVQEPLRDHARLTMLSIGSSVHLLKRSHFRAGVAVDGRAGSIDVDTRGQTSGRSLKADHLLLGIAAGPEISWIPSASVPVALQASALFGMLKPINRSDAVDAYLPYRDKFAANQLRIGVSWLNR